MTQPMKMRIFPSITLFPNGYLTVFAFGKKSIQCSRTTPHAFPFESGGEIIWHCSHRKGRLRLHLPQNTLLNPSTCPTAQVCYKLMNKHCFPPDHEQPPGFRIAASGTAPGCDPPSMMAVGFLALRPWDMIMPDSSARMWPPCAEIPPVFMHDFPSNWIQFRIWTA